MLHEDQWDVCSTHFTTKPRVSARWLKAQREELTNMRAVQHGNRAVVENLVQYVTAELGEQRYEDIIQENIAGIKEEQASCQEATQKALEDLEKQLEGDVMETLTGMQRYVGPAGRTFSVVLPRELLFSSVSLFSLHQRRHSPPIHSTHLRLCVTFQQDSLSLTERELIPHRLL